MVNGIIHVIMSLQKRKNILVSLWIVFLNWYVWMNWFTKWINSTHFSATRKKEESLDTCLIVTLAHSVAKFV